MKKLFLTSALLTSLVVFSQDYVMNSTSAETYSIDDTKIRKEIVNYKYVQFENVYFSNNSYELNENSTPVLNDLLEMLQTYPTMEIQLRAHTDNQNSHSYNISLSQNRANAVMEYLIDQGINSKRLSAIGVGETQPLVPCDIDCSLDENTINRRCEIIIVK